MFCKNVPKKRGKPPSTARGAWTSRGITDWNHATEHLKNHSESKWHQDAVVTARMAEQPSVLELQNAAAVKQRKQRIENNRMIILKLFRSVYFLAKNKIPHINNFQDLIDLQIANGDEILMKHIKEGPSNAQYISSFSCRTLLAAIDEWLDQRLVQSLKSSPFFSLLADECEDVSTQEELSICCRWLVDGKPEEHFLSILHIKALDMPLRFQKPLLCS